LKTIKFNDFLSKNYEKHDISDKKQEILKYLLILAIIVMFGTDIVRIVTNLFTILGASIGIT